MWDCDGDIMDKVNEKDHSYIRITIIVLILLTVALSATYAWLALTVTGTKTNSVIIGNLSLKLDDATSDGIYLDNATPVTDTVGLSYTPYKFKITNDGNIPSNYIIYLDNATIPDGTTRMKDEYVKYSLVKNNNIQPSKLLSITKTATGRILDSGRLEVGETNEYDLRMWIDEAATEDVFGTVFTGTIRVEGEQIKE